MTIESPRVRFAWLDYARFLSALAVVFFHYCSNGVRKGVVGTGVEPFGVITTLSDYGYLGVYFFFIVSGFVIFFSALGRTAPQFAAARAVRLYPAFLVCLSATTLVVVASGYQDVTIAQYLANLTMVPTLFGAERVDGVYWTLSLEIFFYFMMFAAISVGLLRYPRALVCAAIALLALAYALGITVPYAFFFAAGCSLALIYKGEKTMLPVFGLASVLSILFSYKEAQSRLIEFPALQPWVVAIIVALFYGAFFWFQKRDVSGAERANRWGSLTYPLYLIHAHVGFAFLSFWQTEANKWLLTPATILVMVAAAHLVATGVEARYLPLWQVLAQRLIARPLEKVSATVVTLRSGLSRLRQA